MALMGGGDMFQKRSWRLNSDRSITPMPDAPVNLGVTYANVVPDPVTGNFLVQGYGQMWEFDPRGSGTWTQKTGTRVPPAAVSAAVDQTQVISAEIQNYGVDMYVGCNISDCHMYLYKHASGTSIESKLSAVNRTEAPGLSIVYDVCGRAVARLAGGMAWDRKGVPAGVYLIVRNQIKQKVIVIR
jgi:hypothetical protein